MSYLEKKISKELRKILSDKKEFLKAFRDDLDLFVKSSDALKTKETSELLDVATRANILPSMTYNGKQYPIRIFSFEEQDGDGFNEYIIATSDLFTALCGHFEIPSELDAMAIDDEIYFYVEPDIFLLSGKEIVENHLDEKFTFVEEVKSHGSKV